MQIVYTVDGERVHRTLSIGGNVDLAAAFEKPTVTGDAMEARLRVRIPVKAGPHAVGVAFVEDFPGVDTVRLQPFLRSSYDTLDWTGRPHIEMFSIAGPFNPAGPGDTPSRRRIFECRPTTGPGELPCAKRIISSLARQAYRRSPTEADLEHALGFYEAGRRDGSFESGIQAALQFILASPNFVFRVERDPENVAAGAVYRISDIELASRLSFFLWSSIPDAELLDLATRGRLADPAVREHQIRRMLADPRSHALVSNFAGQWLQLRNVRTVLPNSEVFPDFDDNLRESFLRETEMLFESVMREDRNVLDLLRADYTFVNERLARHYHMPNIYGSAFRRVPVTDEARRGLLGQGSILAVTSHAERTSPVLRGKWILENLLGTPPPPPPPGRAGAGGQERESPDRAGADGAAPGEPRVRQLPQDHGPARLRLSRTSTPSSVADGGGRRADRPVRSARGWRERGGRRRAPAGDSSPPRAVCVYHDREDADIQSRAGHRLPRHAGGPGRGPAGGSPGLPVLVHRPRYRQQRALSDAAGEGNQRKLATTELFLRVLHVLCGER